ncbi:GNAT family N-acetyltransferase [Microbacterium sp.]|uniref:GNAT family N-acetyltransferase n=1 Tax=Microbacterium sp. TaxID=51671 RepID=UPI0039E3489E
MSEAIDITPVVLPDAVDAPDADDLHALIDVFNRALEYDLGVDHLRWEASEMLPEWRDQTYRMHQGFLARRGGRAVGAAQLTAPREEGARALEFDLLAAPEARDCGVEAALLKRLYAQALEWERPVVQTYTLHRIDEAAERLAAPTGFGWVPRDAQTALYLDSGFALGQVERNSMFDLRADPSGVRAMLAGAEDAAGPEYRLEQWTGATPDALVEGFAFVLSRMSTDPPQAGLEVVETVWDADRVRSRDARLAASGLLVLVSAVVHVPTGRVVAYNELTIGADRTRKTQQWGTLVVKEHRGHRLGTIVKCAGILRWRELVPESPFITTFNAEENRPMLDVNEAIGFTPIVIAGAWQKELA